MAPRRGAGLLRVRPSPVPGRRALPPAGAPPPPRTLPRAASRRDTLPGEATLSPIATGLLYFVYLDDIWVKKVEKIKLASIHLGNIT